MKKVLGLVLELNPFHNGHLYFIQEAKKTVQPDVTIAVVSSSFTMRGEVSVIDKFTKTRLMLEAGIDLVFELPFLSAVNSADYFAYNALKILTDLGITDLAFGVELAHTEKLLEMKRLVNSELFQNLIRKELDRGFAYGTSAYRAIKQITADEEIIQNFTLPNNTLAVQYLRAVEELNPNINCSLIKRIANNYYDREARGSIASATAIREKLSGEENVEIFIPRFTTPIRFLNPRVAEAKIFFLLQYRAAVLNPERLEKIHGMTEGLENRFLHFIRNASSYEDLVQKMQTKRYGSNKIKRLLLHILLETDKKYEKQKLSCLRMLGADDKGLEYLKRLPKEIKKSIITTFKQHETEDLIEKELQATRLYGLLADRELFEAEEYKIPIILGGNNDD
jgi:predicted nucleotidyltransferase